MIRRALARITTPITPTFEPPVITGRTYFAPIALTATDVRVLRFVARQHDGEHVQGDAHLPDGTTQPCEVPLHALRRTS